MKKACKNCKSSCKYKVWTGISGSYTDMMQAKTDNEDVVLGIYNGVQGYGLFRENEENSVTCKNRFSPYFEDGISKDNVCECWEPKKDRSKHGLSVFDNYKCDGQLVMNFDGTDINIKEENSKNIVTRQL